MPKYRTVSEWIYVAEGRRRVPVGEELELSEEVGERLIKARCVVPVEGDGDGGDNGPPENPETTEAVDLNDLTVAQLKEYATELEIELKATKKADIIAEIEAAQGE